MWWKNVKEHYRIEHIVHVRGDKIYVGSGYMLEIMAISKDGVLVEKYSTKNLWSPYENLARYEREMLADPKKLRKLVKSPDTFERSLPTYTFEWWKVVEKFCEKRGWPNVTHDGEIMYDNTFFVTEREAAEHGKDSLASGIRMIRGMITRAEAELAEFKESLSSDAKALAALEKKYPG